uniref:Uncharacterized protein n=1 Tax=Gluconacetobacter diazotrophicus TaxID=33996 RepID=Q8KKH2_GLUDI|nr:unknown [Gluconacetobacter diazotrophicus]
MVIADRAHQVAMGFVQVGTHDGPRGADVVAGIVQQRAIDDRGRGIGESRDRDNPKRIHLHDAQVVRAVRIVMHQAVPSALHGLDRRQHPGRQVIERRGQRHAAQIRHAHSGSPFCGSTQLVTSGSAK